MNISSIQSLFQIFLKYWVGKRYLGNDNICSFITFETIENASVRKTHTQSPYIYVTLETPNCLGGIIFLVLPCTVNIIPDDALLMAGTGPLRASTYSHMIRIYSGAALRRLMSLELPPVSAGCRRPSWRLINENAFKIFNSQRNIEKDVLLCSQDCAY